jgi:hypothetical protein
MADATLDEGTEGVADPLTAVTGACLHAAFCTK